MSTIKEFHALTAAHFGEGSKAFVFTEDAVLLDMCSINQEFLERWMTPVKVGAIEGRFVINSIAGLVGNINVQANVTRLQSITRLMEQVQSEFLDLARDLGRGKHEWENIKYLYAAWARALDHVEGYAIMSVPEYWEVKK